MTAQKMKQLGKNTRVHEFEKGIGYYSFIFASDLSSTVKLVLRNLKVVNDVEEYTINHPTIYLSVQEPAKFIALLKKTTKKK